MSSKDQLDRLIKQLSEEKLRRLIEYAEFLLWSDERESWQQAGLRQFAKAFGPDEPEYTPADVKPEQQP